MVPTKGRLKSDSWPHMFEALAVTAIGSGHTCGFRQTKYNNNRGPDVWERCQSRTRGSSWKMSRSIRRVIRGSVERGDQVLKMLQSFQYKNEWSETGRSCEVKCVHWQWDISSEAVASRPLQRRTSTATITTPSDKTDSEVIVMNCLSFPVSS